MTPPDPSSDPPPRRPKGRPRIHHPKPPGRKPGGQARDPSGRPRVAKGWRIAPTADDQLRAIVADMKRQGETVDDRGLGVTEIGVVEGLIAREFERRGLGEIGTAQRVGDE